jgi:hypothetical protein
MVGLQLPNHSCDVQLINRQPARNGSPISIFSLFHIDNVLPISMSATTEDRKQEDGEYDESFLPLPRHQGTSVDVDHGVDNDDGKDSNEGECG